MLLENQTDGKRDYPKAIVAETYPDAYNRVRSIKLTLGNGRMIDLDIQKVVLLEGSNDYYR